MRLCDHPGMTPAPESFPGEQAGTPATSPTTDIVAGPGGVMTDEVGVITGELTLRTDLAGGSAVVRVQYTGAAEWYTITGGRTELTDPRDSAAVHRIAVGLLNRLEG